MIIGIAGRIGSGKDTVGEIIQELCLSNHGPVFEVKKFAGKLKQIASLLTGIPVEDFEDQEFKKSYLGAEWGTVESNPLNAVPVFEDIAFNHLMSVRELLQKLGTEAIRDGLHPNAWVNALMCEYKRPKMSEYNPSNWIITDVRFPNELAAVNDVNGLTIRVVRCTWKPNAGDVILIKVFADWTTITYTHTDDDGNHYGVGTDGYKYKSSQIKQSNLHPSETAVDFAKFDYEIINDGSIADLIEKVRQILITEKII